jgi:hypothetical protein
METFDSVIARREAADPGSDRRNGRSPKMPRSWPTRRKPLTVVRHVDGVIGAPESAVKPDGVIVYDYGRIDQVAEYVLDIVRELSPVDSGDYVRSHVMMLNGVVVDNDLSLMEAGRPHHDQQHAAYTRKIEIGRKGYRAHGSRLRKGSVASAPSRFGNIANVFFTFEAAPRAWAATTSPLARSACCENRTIRRKPRRMADPPADDRHRGV